MVDAQLNSLISLKIHMQSQKTLINKLDIASVEMLDLGLEQERKKYLDKMDAPCLCMVWWIVAFEAIPEPLAGFLGGGLFWFCFLRIHWEWTGKG